MTRKNSLQSRLRTYEKRREKIRADFGKGYRMNPEYTKKVITITNKIRSYKQRIRQIDGYEKNMAALSSVVCKFFEIDTFRRKAVGASMKIGNYRTEEGGKIFLARYIFCKLAIEKLNVNSRYISDFVGSKSNRPDYAWKARKSFNSKIKNNSEVMKLWQSFKQFMKHEQDIKH